MADVNGKPVPFAGVVRVPAKAVHIDIQKQVATLLAGVPQGQTMAVVNVVTGAGVNLAIAHKAGKHWTVGMYVGKSGWDQPIEGGASVAFSR